MEYAVGTLRKLRTRNAERALVGAVGILVAVVYLREVSRLPMGTMQNPGAAFFPLVMGIAFAVVSVATVLTSLFPQQKREDPEWPTGTGRRRLLAMMSTFFGYLFILPYAGHFVSSVLFCLLLLRSLSNHSWLRAGVWALLLSVTVHLIFVGILGVRLPIGIVSI